MTRDSIERAAVLIAIWVGIIFLLVCANWMVQCKERAGEEMREGKVSGKPLTGHTVAEKIPSTVKQSNPVRTASWYSEVDCKQEGSSGVWTASGEKFFDEGLTCAMRSRDFGRYYRVTNLTNGKFVICRHNDFGPSKKLHEQGRVVDLSKGAFRKIADLREGVVRVRIEMEK